MDDEKPKYSPDDISEKACLWRLHDIVFHNFPFGGSPRNIEVTVNLADLDRAMSKISRMEKIYRAIQAEMEDD